MNANVAWRHNEEYSKVCHNKSIEPAKFDKKKKNEKYRQLRL